MNRLFNRLFPFCILFLGILVSCKTPPKPEIKLIDPPEFSQADEPFANVYKILDGEWNGEFIILEDSNPRPLSEVNLTELTNAHIESASLKEVNRIKVNQVYTSESPYFQRVVITDYYPDSDKTEVSTGVNKIEDGKMSCIVDKPNEKIIHHGSTRGDDTIIWSSNQKSPQKIEFFQETVGEKFYEIIGYGYYAGDDATISPRLWFYGKYERANSQ